MLGETLAATGIFNREYLQHLVDAHQSGARDYSAPLWSLLMFEAFLRKVLDETSQGDGSPVASAAIAEAVLP